MGAPFGGIDPITNKPVRTPAQEIEETKKFQERYYAWLMERFVTYGLDKHVPFAVGTEADYDTFAMRSGHIKYDPNRIQRLITEKGVEYLKTMQP